MNFNSTILITEGITPTKRIEKIITEKGSEDVMVENNPLITESIK